MKDLPGALSPLAIYPQFILWVMRGGKKLPIDYRTGQVADAHSPLVWMSADTALANAAMFGNGYGVGFVFTEQDPFFFVDIDKCLLEDNVTWSPLSIDLVSRLGGAAVEVSQSGRGLHIFGVGTLPEHSNKNIKLGIELYTQGRFVALTGTNALGSAAIDCSTALPSLVSDYFPPREGGAGAGWTSEPVPEWTGETEDAELIKKASSVNGGSSVFSGRASFAELWNADEDTLANAYPDNEGGRTYDASSADMALAQHLAFWTGKNCERIQSLMLQSALVRDKWEREDYLYRTILNAVAMQQNVYSVGTIDTVLEDKYSAVKLRASSVKQRVYAEGIRSTSMHTVADNPELCGLLAKIPTAKVWIDNQHRTAEEIAALITPVVGTTDPPVSSPVIITGYQYLGATQQIAYFKGCIYIQDAHRIFTPKGALLRQDQFNATYGGYIFQLDDAGDKVTRKAWEAFTESQIVRYPKAESSCFRPSLAPGAILEINGTSLVNTYVPIETPRLQGDITPFLTHVAKLLPDAPDREILLAYMAACVQHKGVKFQWAPLIQGAEGNGKTLLTRCVAFAIGDKYTHFPPSNEIAEKFNAWLFDKLFIGVEDVYVADHKKEVIEVLKPMITNDKLAKRAMQQDQITADVCANFMLNSNHKDAIRKTRTDRRFAVFYTAQQEIEDFARDGMDGAYFPQLYAWLRDSGYAIVSEYLNTYRIPDALNPATLCLRAPETSSTQEALTASMGRVEQEILEAVGEGRSGFAGGWISSVALTKLLEETRLTRNLPPTKRRGLLKSIGYDYHPSLRNGRVDNVIAIDFNKKPQLYVRKGHININIKTSSAVAKAYIEAQSAGRAVAPNVFGGTPA